MPPAASKPKPRLLCPWPACLFVRMLSEKHLLPRLFVGFPVLLLGSPYLYFLSVPGTPFLFQVLSILDSAKQNPAFGQYSGNSDRQGKKDEVSVRRVAACMCTVLSLSLILCPWTSSGPPLASVPHSIGNLVYQLFCCLRKGSFSFRFQRSRVQNDGKGWQAAGAGS